MEKAPVSPLDTICSICKTRIIGKKISAVDLKMEFHPECFKCTIGGHMIAEKFHMIGDSMYCSQHYEKLQKEREEARASKLRADPAMLARNRQRLEEESARYADIKDDPYWIAVDREKRGIFSKYADENFTPETMLFVSGVNPEYRNWLDYDFARFPEGSELYRDGFTPSDISQGSLGDCYFLSAIAVLCDKPHLFRKVFCVPHGVSEKAAEALKLKHGIYAMRFWKNGKERIIVVDDQFPVLGGAQFRAAFGRSSDKQEMWVSLLEKGYAKLHGSYEAIVGGYVDEALADLTGGLPFRISFDYEQLDQEKKDKIWSDLLSHYQAGYLLGAGSPAGSDAPENASEDGIVQGHAYSVNKVISVPHRNLRLIQLRNPWGHKESSGAWADGSAEWTMEMIQLLEQKDADDGSFWMAFEDFLQNYKFLYVCRFFDEQKWPTQWRTDGEWRGATAGGCLNNESGAYSPQFTVEVECETDLVVNLSQQEHLMDEKQQFYSIGLQLFNSRGHRVSRKRPGLFLAQNIEGGYAAERDVTLDTKLPGKGIYTILVSTFQPGLEGKFHLEYERNLIYLYPLI